MSTWTRNGWSRSWIATNVKTVVILTGMWGDKLQHVIDEMVKPYPGRFIVFTQIDWQQDRRAGFRPGKWCGSWTMPSPGALAG